MKEYTLDDSTYKILEMENQFIEIKGKQVALGLVGGKNHEERNIRGIRKILGLKCQLYTKEAVEIEVSE